MRVSASYIAAHNARAVRTSTFAQRSATRRVTRNNDLQLWLKPLCNHDARQCCRRCQTYLIPPVNCVYCTLTCHAEYSSRSVMSLILKRIVSGATRPIIVPLNLACDFPLRYWSRKSIVLLLSCQRFTWFWFAYIYLLQKSQIDFCIVCKNLIIYSSAKSI